MIEVDRPVSAMALVENKKLRKLVVHASRVTTLVVNGAGSRPGPAGPAAIIQGGKQTYRLPQGRTVITLK